jgi:hypothetical protein
MQSQWRRHLLTGVREEGRRAEKIEKGASSFETRSAALPATTLSHLRTVTLAAAILSGTAAGIARAKLPDDMAPLGSRYMPPAPDYASPNAWAALPDRLSAADVVPPHSNATDQQASARADVFFVHPTTYMSSHPKNARYDEPGMTKVQLDFQVLSFEAAAFNGCCRIFAPRYRQASIASFLGPGPQSRAAFDTAYSDVLRAFDYYVSHDNGGRPFIIASHSQGSLHAMRLLQDRIIGTSLQKRLVAAYLIGWAIPEDIERTGLRVCRSAREIGCVIGWNSVTPWQTLDFMRDLALLWLNGRYQLLGDRHLVCVNPLSWTKDGDAPASANLGSLPRSELGEPLEPPVPELTGAACEDGVLQVFLAHEVRVDFGYRPKLGSFHSFDYNLFYMNIRRNAADRVATFLANHI